MVLPSSYNGMVLGCMLLLDCSKCLCVRIRVPVKHIGQVALPCVIQLALTEVYFVFHCMQQLLAGISSSISIRGASLAATCHRVLVEC